MAERRVRFLSEHPLRKGTLKGWRHTQDAEDRHRHLREAIEAHGYKRVEHALGALHVADKSRDPEVAEIAKRDEHWVAEHYGADASRREGERELARE